MDKFLSMGVGVISIQLADVTRLNPLCEELHQLKVCASPDHRSNALGSSS